MIFCENDTPKFTGHSKYVLLSHNNNQDNSSKYVEFDQDQYPKELFFENDISKFMSVCDFAKK